MYAIGNCCMKLFFVKICYDYKAGLIVSPLYFGGIIMFMSLEYVVSLARQNESNFILHGTGLKAKLMYSKRTTKMFNF